MSGVVTLRALERELRRYRRTPELEQLCDDLCDRLRSRSLGLRDFCHELRMAFGDASVIQLVRNLQAQQRRTQRSQRDRRARVHRHHQEGNNHGEDQSDTEDGSPGARRVEESNDDGEADESDRDEETHYDTDVNYGYDDHSSGSTSAEGAPLPSRARALNESLLHPWFTLNEMAEELTAAAKCGSITTQTYKGMIEECDGRQMCRPCEDGEDEDQCPVCFNPCGATPHVTQCNHRFCHGCWGRWKAEHGHLAPTCPLCRTITIKDSPHPGVEVLTHALLCPTDCCSVMGCMEMKQVLAAVEAHDCPLARHEVAGPCGEKPNCITCRKWQSVLRLRDHLRHRLRAALDAERKREHPPPRGASEAAQLVADVVAA